MMPQESEITRLRRRLGALKRDAETWRGHWEELRANIDPFRGRFLVSEGTDQDNHGGKVHGEILDNAAERALDILAAGIQGGLASPQLPWLRWTVQDREALEIPGVRTYLDDASQMTLDVLRMSNFYEALHNFYKENGCFGTAAMLKQKSRTTVVNFYPMTIGEYYLAQGPDLMPHTLYRRFSMTVEQMKEEFGLEALDQWTRQQWDNGQYDLRVPIVHVIQPRQNRSLSSDLSTDMAWESIYFAERTRDDKVLRRSGFRKCPFVAARWELIGTDVYGRGPGMRALPHVKQLQAMTRDKLRAINRHVNPPMKGSPGLKAQGGGSLVGGSITYINPMDQETYEPAITVNPNITSCVTEIMRIDAQIQAIFYADRLLAITNVDRQMTAYEVRHRTIEKLQILGPIAELLESKVITPLVEGTWQDMIEWGLVPEPPPEIDGLALKIQYRGLLSQIQRGQDSVTIESVLQFVNALAAAQAATGEVPDVVDKVDFDQGVDEVVEIFGAPARMFRDDEAVAERRAARAQKQMQNETSARMQAVAEQAPNVAGAMKTASETRMPGGNSFLDMLYGMGGRQQ